MRKILVPVLLTLGLAVAACSDVTAGPAASEPTASTVVYEVEGSAESVSVTLQTPTGISQQNDLSVPVINKAGTQGLRIDAFPQGEFVYISAQNEGEFGDVTCRITVDDEVISENTASGGFAIATCQGVS